MKKLSQRFRLSSHYPKPISKGRNMITPSLPVALAPNRAIVRQLVGCACLIGLFGVSLEAAANSIQDENLKPGTWEWYSFYPLGSKATDNVHNLEGYANKDSVGIGESISFHVSGNPTRYPTHTLRFYRMGYYQGMGGRKMSLPATYTQPTDLTTKAYTIPAPDATGMVSANWPADYTMTIPSDWPSGIYVATIVNDAWGDGQYIPFVVRDKNSTAPYLFQSSTTTYQAYNAWGGKSLYGYNSTGNVPARRVSYNRPYDVGAGLGSLLGWEINMLYFLEKEGYDVTYQSNTDTHEDGGNLLKHQAFLSVGHDEYWTKAMRDNVESARNHGVALGFFGANDAYWQMRFADNNRTIVSYKDFSMSEDPFVLDSDPSNDHLITTRWRNGGPGDWRKGPFRPENELIGVMYAYGPGAAVVNNAMVSTKSDPSIRSGTAPHPLLNKTFLTVGSSIPGLVGYEADRVFDDVGTTPAGLTILAASPVPLGTVDLGFNHQSALSANYDPANPKSHMTVYSRACTVVPCKNPVSTVFATGSLQWVWGINTAFKYPFIDPYGSAQVLARNVLGRMVNPPALAAATTPSTLLASLPTSLAFAIDTAINTVISPAYAAAPPTTTVTEVIPDAPTLIEVVKQDKAKDDAKKQTYKTRFPGKALEI